MSTILQQLNWRMIGTAAAVVAVGAAASYGFLDADTRNMVVSFLLGGAAGAVAVPSAGIKGGNV